MENSLIISLLVLFIHFTFWTDEIFGGIRKLIPPKGKLYKAIYGCPGCMTPWWGTAIYWIFFNNNITDWILTVGAASGISVIYVVLLSLRGAAVEIKKDLKDGN